MEMSEGVVIVVSFQFQCYPSSLSKLQAEILLRYQEEILLISLKIIALDRQSYSYCFNEINISNKFKLLHKVIIDNLLYTKQNLMCPAKLYN